MCLTPSFRPFTLFGRKVTKKRVKCKRKTVFLFHFRSASNFAVKTADYEKREQYKKNSFFFIAEMEESTLSLVQYKNFAVVRGKVRKIESNAKRMFILITKVELHQGSVAICILQFNKDFLPIKYVADKEEQQNVGNGVEEGSYFRKGNSIVETIVDE